MLSKLKLHQLMHKLIKLLNRITCCEMILIMPLNKPYLYTKNILDIVISS